MRMKGVLVVLLLSLVVTLAMPQPAAKADPGGSGCATYVAQKCFEGVISFIVGVGIMCTTDNSWFGPACRWWVSRVIASRIKALGSDVVEAIACDRTQAKALLGSWTDDVLDKLSGCGVLTDVLPPGRNYAD